MAKKRKVARRKISKSRKTVKRKPRSVKRSKTQGVSRKTLAVMLVLVIAVSVLGTWFMLNSGLKAQQAQSSTYGTISLSVKNLGIGTAPVEVVQDNTGGSVKLAYKGFKN